MSSFMHDLSRNDKLHLVYGYTRRECLKYSPNVIADLCLSYYDEALYWNIDEQLFQKLVVAKNGEEFTCDYIKYHNTDIRWHISIYPHGMDNKDIGYVRYWIEFDELPVNIISITASSQLILIADKKEITSFRMPSIFNHDVSNPSVGNYPFRLSLSDIKHCKTMQLISDIDFFDMEFKNDIDIDQYGFLAKIIEIDDKLEYEWKISDEILNEIKYSRSGEIFRSNTFGIGGNWNLFLHPNGQDKGDKGDVCLGLNLLRLPNILESINIDYKLSLITDTQTIEFQENADLNYNDFSWTWPEKTCSTQLLLCCCSLTIHVTIDILLQRKKLVIID